MVKKHSLSFLVLVFLVATIQSCDMPIEESKNEGQLFNENLNEFSNTIDKVDSTLDLMDQLQKDIDQIEQDRANGLITDEEAIDKLNIINNRLGRKIAKQTSTNVVGLPRWAKKLGLSEPQGMAFDQDYSQSTSERNPAEGFNSVIMVYRGEYNHAMNQASQIAQKAGIPMSKDYQDAIKLKEDYGIETIKGASYMNFEIGSDNNPKYNISITVDDDGTLTINATDYDSFLRQMDSN